MKIKSKKLILAVSLLLISAVMLGTASFAWFSMNTEVAVDGIEVEAYSDSLFLEISKDDGANYDTSVTLEGAKKTLRLVTQKTLAAGYQLDAKSLFGEYIANEVYVLTFDATYVDGNEYYENGYVEATGLVAGDDLTGFYTYSGSTYDEASGVYESGTYYLPGMVAVDTTSFDENTSVASYYEKVATVYAKKTAGASADTHAANNYDSVVLTGASSVADYYKNPIITLVTGGTYSKYIAATGTYDSSVEYFGYSNGSYTALDTSTDFADGVTDMTSYFVANPAEYYAKGTMEGQYTYTKATLADGAQLKGYYTIAGAPQYAGATYDGTSDYYVKGADTYTLQKNLKKADALDGYYALDVMTLNLADVVDAKDETKAKIAVYAADSFGYSYVGEFDKNANITNTVYWARGYSNGVDEYAASSTLNVLRSGFENYYLMKTVKLRCAKDTNDAADLTIAKVNVGGAYNDFNKALNVVFDVTSESGESKVVVFKNAEADTFNANGVKLFDKILGNEKEVVTVDMYIFFDGEYEGAKTSNIAQIAGQAIEVEFTIADHPYN